MHLHGDVAGAQHDRVHGLGGHLRHQFGALLQFGAQHLARQLHGGARQGLRRLAVELAELAVEGLEQGADLRRRLLREALLEALQRDQPVAVAFLVAGLARRATRACQSSAVGGDGVRRSALPPAPDAPPKVPGFQLAKSPSSSRGMKRA